MDISEISEGTVHGLHFNIRFSKSTAYPSTTPPTPHISPYSWEVMAEIVWVMSITANLTTLLNIHRGWRKSTGCCFRGARFGSQQPHRTA